MLFRVLFFLIFCGNFVASQTLKRIKIQDFQIATLSDSLRETSGLFFFDNHLLSFNDSGNSADLFLLDPKTGILQRHLRTHLVNKDWEAVTASATHLFIGDIGNNDGTREDLTIYKVPFSGMDFDWNSTLKITFHYPEQKDFIPRNLNTDFDAESMIFYNDKIQVFTKEWSSKKVTRYEVDPNIVTKQDAQKIESYTIGFSVTDAAYYNGKLYLVGYTKMAKVYLSVFEESKEGLFFSQPPARYYLGSALSIGQIEGIAVNEDGLFLSNERFKTIVGTVPQRLYFIPAEKLKL